MGQKFENWARNKIFRDYSIFDCLLPAKHTFKKFENENKTKQNAPISLKF